MHRPAVYYVALPSTRRISRSNDRVVDKRNVTGKSTVCIRACRPNQTRACSAQDTTRLSYSCDSIAWPNGICADGEYVDLEDGGERVRNSVLRERCINTLSSSYDFKAI